jgi:hypothetical protein
MVFQGSAEATVKDQPDHVSDPQTVGPRTALYGAHRTALGDGQDPGATGISFPSSCASTWGACSWLPLRCWSFECPVCTWGNRASVVRNYLSSRGNHSGTGGLILVRGKDEMVMTARSWMMTTFGNR